nr:hypothetical protein 15 [Balneolaceae bacterium]
MQLTVESRQHPSGLKADSPQGERTWKGYSLEELLRLVASNRDGFDFAQLQTGINRHELTEILEDNDFIQCNECLSWQPFENYENASFDGFDNCKSCEDEAFNDAMGWI